MSKDLPKVLYLLEDRRDIEVDFTLTIERRTRRRFARVLELTKDYLLVQIRKCPSEMAANAWPQRQVSGMCLVGIRGLFHSREMVPDLVNNQAVLV